MEDLSWATIGRAKEKSRKINEMESVQLLFKELDLASLEEMAIVD